MLSDSGSLTEDASILKFPAVAIRDVHERPEGMDVGTVVMCGVGSERVLQAILLVTQQLENGLVMPIVPDYDVEQVSQKVVRIIHSYVDYIQRTVWSRQEEEKKELEIA